MTTISITDIAPAFAFAVARGLAPGPVTYNPHEFGNASVELAGRPFSLRFERDRGQIFVDIGNEDLGWWKLEHVLEFVDRSITQAQLGEPPDPQRLASLLERSWNDVMRVFEAPRLVAQLDQFSKQKNASLLANIFGKP